MIPVSPFIVILNLIAEVRFLYYKPKNGRILHRLTLRAACAAVIRSRQDYFDKEVRGLP